MKTAFVTGANRSIGFETVKQLAQQGYYVYLGSRDLTHGQDAVAQLHAAGITQVEAIQIDVADAASVRAAAALLAQKSPSLDVLVNNAGILGGFEQAPSKADTATIRTVFDVNFFGVIEVTQACLPLLQQSTAPRIVNVTSGLGSLTLHSDPAWKYFTVKGAAYVPSKTALNAYTLMLAYELRDTAFKVNAVDPGYTATDFNHHSGHGTVQDAARIIVKYATIGTDGPTGKFLSNDIAGEESPW